MKLTQVFEQVTAEDELKWDLLLDKGEMRFGEGNLCSSRLDRTLYPKGLSPTPWATSQMCNRLGIPTAYFKRCPLWLRDAQVNHWLHQEPEGSRRMTSRGTMPGDRWLLRAKGEVLRGVLSDRYAKLNNADALCTLKPLVENRFEVQWLALTDETFHLRLTDPRLSRDILPGDRVMAGIHVANSEVGKRSVTVDALVYRLVCQNGLIRLVKGKSLLHQRHVGLTPAHLQAALGRAIEDALIQSAGFMERMSWATRERLGGVEKTLDALPFSQTLRETVRTSLLSEPKGQQETLYGLVNALTFTAQGLEPDERYTLEAMAGTILESGVQGIKGGLKENSLQTPEREIGSPFQRELFEGEALRG